MVISGQQINSTAPSEAGKTVNTRPSSAATERTHGIDGENAKGKGDNQNEANDAGNGGKSNLAVQASDQDSKSNGTYPKDTFVVQLLVIIVPATRKTGEYEMSTALYYNVCVLCAKNVNPSKICTLFPNTLKDFHGIWTKEYWVGIHMWQTQVLLGCNDRSRCLVGTYFMHHVIPISPCLYIIVR